MLVYLLTVFFFFNDTATTEIYTLSLHDALPICDGAPGSKRVCRRGPRCRCDAGAAAGRAARAGHRRRGRPARGAAAVPVAGGLSRGGGFPRGDEIGRASWRERGEISVVAVSFKKKKKEFDKNNKAKIRVVIIQYTHQCNKEREYKL